MLLTMSGETERNVGAFNLGVGNESLTSSLAILLKTFYRFRFFDSTPTQNRHWAQVGLFLSKMISGMSLQSVS